MIAMVVNADYTCLCMSDIPPIYKANGKLPVDYDGCNTCDHISEGHEAWKAAIDRCLATQADTNCDFYNEFQEEKARWWAQIRYIEEHRVLITFRRVPLSIHKLSLREREVLNEVAEGKTNFQVSETLDIAQSTVEKHRSNIRQTLDLSSEQELQLTAWIVANPDIFNDLP